MPSRRVVRPGGGGLAGHKACCDRACDGTGASGGRPFSGPRAAGPHRDAVRTAGGERLHESRGQGQDRPRAAASAVSIERDRAGPPVVNRGDDVEGA